MTLLQRPVLLVAPRYAPAVGGVERTVEGLARGLVARGVEVEVATTDPTGTLASSEVLDGVRVRRFPTLGHDDIYFLAPALGAWLLRNAQRFGIIHAHSYHTPLALQAAAASRVMGVPLILSTYYHGTGHSLLRRLLHVPYRLPGRWVLHQARELICISEAERELLHQHFGRHLPIHVVPPGVDPDEARAGAWPAPNGRRDVLVLAVGRLHAYKQTRRLVGMLPRLPAHYHLVIIGDGPERAWIERITELLDVQERVRILSSVSRSELLGWYRSADVFVSLSRQESFGISLLEAAMAGSALVVSDIPAHRETARLVPDERVSFVDIDCSCGELAQQVLNAPRFRRPPSIDQWPLPTWERVVDGTMTRYQRAMNPGERAAPVMVDEAASPARTSRRSGGARTRQRLRVLMATPRFAPFIGGAETHVQEVSRRLVERGVEVTVVTADPSGRLPAEEQRGGVDIRRVRSWPNTDDYYFAPQIYGIVGNGRWDLVHCQNFHTFVAPLAMIAARRNGIPYLVSFHSAGDSSKARHSIRGVQRQMLRPLLAGARRLIAVSNFEAEFFRSSLHLPREQFVVIPNGSDELPVLHGGELEVPEAPLIVSIGRLERYKGHHRILAAMPRILADYPSARLRIVGRGPYEQRLRRMASELGVSGQVEIGGIPVDDRHGMAEQLARASLVAQLSEWEAQGVAALNALALGRQLLVADTSALSELVGQGPVRAIPLDSTPDEVAAAVLQQLHRPLPTRSIALPTWDACADALLQEYVLLAEATWRGF